jgi:class 3 adenylate cyclase
MPDLPSGTVTFLFTDIEGSTALWERDRAAMAFAVERHLALLRAAHLRQHIRQPIARWIKAGVEAAIAAERATVAPETFTATWEAGSHVDHITAIAKGLAESQELVQPLTT